MSNRFTSQNRNDYRNSSKPQMKFVPKRDLQNPNSHQTLSNSLRDAATKIAGGDAVGTSTSRVRMGEDGDWVSKASPSGNFVIYLPQDEAVAAGLGPDEGGLDPVESQRVVDMLNRELSRLLKLRPRDFWREVATDDSLKAFLESFLKFRKRWYDFPHRGARGIVAGVIVGEFELCRRVFMVLYRLSSNRDPGAKAADALSPKDHEVLLQDKKLLDLPKLLDVCAIYGHENEDLTQMLVMNAIKAQPYVHNDFPVLLSHFLTIVHTMYQRCSSSLEVLLSSGGHQEQGSSRLLSDYLEVMDFINDSVVSLDSFVNAYKHAAIFFSSPVEMSHGNEELLTILARLHDSLLPSLRRGFRVILGVVEDTKKEISSDMLSNVFTSLKMLSRRIGKFGWTLIYFCYLSDEAFESSNSFPASVKMLPANVEEPLVRADILIQMVRDLGAENMHVPGGQTWGTFIQDIELNHQMMSRIELLQKTGWLSMDDEQFQFLSGIMKTPPRADNIKATSSTPSSVPSNKMQQTDEDMAIIESKISQIKELFPDYGRGYLVACLEAYNHNPEEVIQRILEGTLHEELKSLDISLEQIPPSKSTSSSSVSKHDKKGKGKIIESEISPPEIVGPPKNQVAVSSSSSSSFGRFVRKNTNEVSEFETLNAKKEKELAKTAALISQLEYEDEYDDSFDDLGLSVGDSGLDEPESLGEKMNSQRGRFAEGENGSSSSNPDNSKWGSRKKPQFYVKDGKNYSYKVDGSVAVSNYNEAKLVNQSQKELVHGLGRGGNIPLGSVQRLGQMKDEQNDEQNSNNNNNNNSDEGARRGGRGFGRGRGRKDFRRVTESNDEQEENDDESGGGRGGRGFGRGRGRKDFRRVTESNDEQEENDDESGGRGGRGFGRGGGGRRGRGRSNSYRRDRAMGKHLAGMPGHFN